MPDDPPPGNDPSLMARVLAALSQDEALSNLSVEFVEGTLVLRGTAARRWKAALSERNPVCDRRRS